MAKGNETAADWLFGPEFCFAGNCRQLVVCIGYTCDHLDERNLRPPLFKKREAAPAMRAAPMAFSSL